VIPLHPRVPAGAIGGILCAMPSLVGILESVAGSACGKAEVVRWSLCMDINVCTRDRLWWARLIRDGNDQVRSAGAGILPVHRTAAGGLVVRVGDTDRYPLRGLCVRDDPVCVRCAVETGIEGCRAGSTLRCGVGYRRYGRNIFTLVAGCKVAAERLTVRSTRVTLNSCRRSVNTVLPHGLRTRERDRVLEVHVTGPSVG
jgi:hypothetical protein